MKLEQMTQTKMQINYIMNLIKTYTSDEQELELIQGELWRLSLKTNDDLKTSIINIFE